METAIEQKLHSRYLEHYNVFHSCHQCIYAFCENYTLPHFSSVYNKQPESVFCIMYFLVDIKVVLFNETFKNLDYIQNYTLLTREKLLNIKIYLETKTKQNFY